MADPALEVAQALGPLLAAGADGALEEIRHQLGAGSAAVVRRVVDQLRGRIGDEFEEEQAAATLQDALQADLLSKPELLEALEVLRATQVHHSIQVEGNAYIGNTIRIDGGGNFQG